MNGKLLEEIDPQLAEVEVLVNPAVEMLQESTVAPGMGILYRYHPDTDRRLAEGFPRFIQHGDGRLVVARSGKDIVGYVVIASPDPQERWGHPSAPKLLELGFIEVARGWRKRGIGRKLLRACFADRSLDDHIVLATAYAWHWDLEGTRLSKDAYREVLYRFFRSEGFETFETDELNIAEDPANRLLVRIGPRVTPEVCTQFMALLHTGEGSITAPGKSPGDRWKELIDLLAYSQHIYDPIRWLALWTEMWLPASRRIAISAPRWFLRFQPSKPAGTLPRPASS